MTTGYGPDGVDRSEGGLAWREIGDGAAVVFLHGLGGSRLAWGPQLRALGDRFRCVAWDMPGYGRSAPIEPLNFEAIADAVVRLLDHAGIDRADLVGLSFGGMHALHTALRHPDRVGRMVLADTSPAFGMDGTTAEDWIRSRLDAIESGSTPADLAPAVLDAITASPLTGRVRAESIAAFGAIPNEGFRAAVHCLVTNDVRPRLAQIRHRCLVVVGELDVETPPSYARTLADGLANGELRIIDGAGHLTPAEAPDSFNRLVADFLSS